MIKVLVIDDSALMRQLLTDLLQQAPDIMVVGAAHDPLLARQKIKELNPDVLTLDIEMPGMDGLDFLERLMRLRPMPVVMVSTLTAVGANATLKALELGAVDFLEKPVLDVTQNMAALAQPLIEKIRTAAGARIRARERQPLPPVAVSSSHTNAWKLVAIGSSTGGVEALTDIIPALPATAPPVVIVQHMPDAFLRTFAVRLDSLSKVTVLNPIDRQMILPGHVYLAPGTHHMEVREGVGGLQCLLKDGAPVGNHKPAVTVLFESVARVCGPRAVGVILTGMGRDGADGLLAMRRAGAVTLGQDAASCVVYGMPKAAYDIGAVEREVPLHALPQAIMNAAAG